MKKNAKDLLKKNLIFVKLCCFGINTAYTQNVTITVNANQDKR
jgi:hypothetical protein